MGGVAWADVAAPILFVVCWVGYAWWADEGAGYKHSLMASVEERRHAWMREMVAREVRIVDIQVVQVLVHAIAFFASSTVLVIGGSIGALGARDMAQGILHEIPLAAEAPAEVWYAKVILLIVAFTYAFFKFTWSLRQFNYVVIMIGAAPPHTEAASPRALDHAARAARLATRASEHFNKAMRTYYFGLAALSWFVQPYLFMALTVTVVLVVYRREFRSRSLEALDAAA